MIDFIEVNKYIDELRSAGYTWLEVCEACNKKYNKDYGEAKWRKPYQAWRLTVDDVLQDENNDLLEREIERLARAKVRLDINRKVLNAQKSIIDQEVKKESLYELFNEKAVDMLKALSPKLEKVKLTKNDTQKNYVFARTDSHFNGEQDLNVEFGEMFELIKEKQKQYGFNKIVFTELGDTIEGATLRPSQLMAIKLGIVDQALVVSRYYIDFLNKLANELNINIDFVIVESSNHTELRQFGASRSELPMEDMMKVIADQIKLGTHQNKRINVISAPRVLTEINGMSYLFEHGHNIKNIKTHIRDLETYHSTQIDYGYTGHTHSYNSIDLVYMDNRGFNKNITVVGHSNTNDDEFAQRLLLSSAPSIHFCIDTLEGKEHQENLILKESIKKAKVKVK